MLRDVRFLASCEVIHATRPATDTPAAGRVPLHLLNDTERVSLRPLENIPFRLLQCGRRGPPARRGHHLLTTDNRSDAELLAAVASGQTDALGVLVRRHQAGVLALAQRFLGRWDLAEDVAQDVFVRVFRSAAEYRPEARLTTWLHRIVVNRCLDVVRRERRAPAPLPDGDAAPPAPAAPDPVERREARGRVAEAVAALPDRQRMAVLLHRYEDLSHREIAEAMTCTEGAVESLLVRGYAALRQALADLDESGNPAAGNASGER